MVLHLPMLWRKQIYQCTARSSIAWTADILAKRRVTKPKGLGHYMQISQVVGGSFSLDFAKKPLSGG